MLKKVTLATALVLSMASAVAVAAPGGRDRDNGLQDRQNAAACERAVAPNICK